MPFCASSRITVAPAAVKPLDRLGHTRPSDLPGLAAAAASLHVQVNPVLRDLGLGDLEE
jgi:hypothetical protein